MRSSKVRRLFTHEGIEKAKDSIAHAYLIPNAPIYLTTHGTSAQAEVLWETEFSTSPLASIHA